MDPRASTQVSQHPRSVLENPSRFIISRPAESINRAYGYAAWLEKEPIVTKAVTSFVLSTVSSTIAQLIAGAPNDRTTASKAALFGVTKIPPYSHFWYPILASVNSNPLIRVIVDQVFWRPLLTAYTFLFMGIVQGLTLKQIKEKFRKDYWTTTKAGLKIWPAAEIVNQSVVPLKWRTLFKDLVGVGWDMYLTSVNVQPAASPSETAAAATSAADSITSDEGGEEEEESASGCSGDGSSENDKESPKINPVFPVTAIVISIMYWADRRLRKDKARSV
mmetsp:Transcript_29990/g.60168  ORF Transcript_29990/g.60168 Transcript_29990/m.60168 type:complete len:277 (+) Transcript_29990:108-938(+)